MRLYKYCTIETARAILGTGTIRFQSPINYNDPFDTQWNPFWTLFTEEASEFERDSFEKYIKRLPAGDQEEKRKALAALPRLEDGMTEEVERTVMDVRRRLRLLCLSRTDSSILMWSHYADQHRGVVLAFDSEEMIPKPSNAKGGVELESVEYDEEELPRVIDHEKFIAQFVGGEPYREGVDWNAKAWVRAKHPSWAHEQEQRFVWTAEKGTLGDHADVPFGRQSLAEVTMGCRADVSRGTELRSLALAINAEVKFFRMSADPRALRLVKSPTNLRGTDTLRNPQVID